MPERDFAIFIHAGPKSGYPILRADNCYEELMTEETTQDNVLSLTAEIVSAYVSKNSLPTAALPGLIGQIHQSLTGLSSNHKVEAPVALVPAVPIKKSVTPDYIISLEDGRKFKSMKRYLGLRNMARPSTARNGGFQGTIRWSPPITQRGDPSWPRSWASVGSRTRPLPRRKSARRRQKRAQRPTNRRPAHPACRLRAAFIGENAPAIVVRRLVARQLLQRRSLTLPMRRTPAFSEYSRLSVHHPHVVHLPRAETEIGVGLNAQDRRDQRAFMFVGVTELRNSVERSDNLLRRDRLLNLSLGVSLAARQPANL